MRTHLAIGGFVYCLTLTPWLVLILRQRGWSAFRVLCLWQLLMTVTLMPLMWGTAFSLNYWYSYNVLTWAARCVTVWTFGAVAGELLGFVEIGTIAGALCGLSMAIGLGQDWIATEYRIAGAVTAALCAYAARYPEKRMLAAGLLVLTLFPAISETPSVLEFGGWLRFVPTVSAWIALGIWLTHTRPSLAARPCP